MKTYNQFINEGLQHQIKKVLRKPISHFKKNRKRYLLAVAALVSVGSMVVLHNIGNKEVTELDGLLKKINTIVGDAELYNKDIDDIKSSIEDNIEQAEKLLKSIHKNSDFYISNK